MYLQELKNLRQSIFENKDYTVTLKNKKNHQETKVKKQGNTEDEVLQLVKKQYPDYTIVSVRVNTPVRQYHNIDYSSVVDDKEATKRGYHTDAEEEKIRKHVHNEISDKLDKDLWDYVDEIGEYAEDKKAHPELAKKIQGAFDKHEKTKQTREDDRNLEKDLKGILDTKNRDHFIQWYADKKEI